MGNRNATNSSNFQEVNLGESHGRQDSFKVQTEEASLVLNSATMAVDENTIFHFVVA